MDDLQALGRLLKTKRTAANLSAGELAAEIREVAEFWGEPITLSQQAISYFENGRAKSRPRWLRHAKAALEKSGVKAKELFTEADEQRFNPFEPVLREVDDVDEALLDEAAEYPTDAKGALVDVVRAMRKPGMAERLRAVVEGREQSDGAVAVRRVDLSYAMGDGTDLADYPEEEDVLYDAGFLRRITRAPAHRLFVARGDGDSMFPTLINDDEVVIDTTQRILNMQDRIWACAFRGAGMIKRLRIVGEQLVEIRSDNQTVPPQTVSAEDLHIVGRVIWVGRRV